MASMVLVAITLFGMPCQFWAAWQPLKNAYWESIPEQWLAWVMPFLSDLKVVAVPKSYDYGTAIKVMSGNGNYDTVGTHFFRIIHADAYACLDARRHNQR